MSIKALHSVPVLRGDNVEEHDDTAIYGDDLHWSTNGHLSFGTVCLDPVCLGILVIVPCATVVIILDSNDSLSNVTLHLPNVPPQSPMLIFEELDFLECVACRMVMGLRSQSMPFKWHKVNVHQALLMTPPNNVPGNLPFFGTDHCLEYTLVNV